MHSIIRMHARLRQTDGRTDGQTNIMAIARRFLLRTHLALKMIYRRTPIAAALTPEHSVVYVLSAY